MTAYLNLRQRSIAVWQASCICTIWDKELYGSCDYYTVYKEEIMLPAVGLWLLGVPVVVIILLWLFHVI